MGLRNSSSRISPGCGLLSSPALAMVVDDLDISRSSLIAYETHRPPAVSGHVAIPMLECAVPSIPIRQKKPTSHTADHDRPALLLAWYDRHRRRLPWRALPGERADAYRVWLSEIMLQQTGVKTVGPYFEKFLGRWPDVAAMAQAPLAEVLRMWARLGYYSPAANLHALAGGGGRGHGGAFRGPQGALRP